MRDEKDVKSVLVRQKDNLDTQYLKKWARDAGVLKVLETIIKSSDQLVTKRLFILVLLWITSSKGF